MKSKHNNEVSYTLLRISTRLQQLNKKVRNYGTDQQLSDAEIHLIKLIKENEGMHVTGLAELLEVSKGAVSQISIKLVRKGMIEKRTDPENLSKLSLYLTPKGEIADKRHKEIHMAMDEQVNELLSDVEEDKLDFLKEFLHSLEIKLNEYNE
ncbi:MAG: MarR family transcriptional regulator [Spirochaetales bacterium]|nr:MarR family transcriptional regulator [Spirochaetales bacterium]